MYKECLTKTIIMYKKVNVNKLAKELATIRVKNRYKLKGFLDKFYVDNYDEFMSLTISPDAKRDIEKRTKKYLEHLHSIT